MFMLRLYTGDAYPVESAAPCGRKADAAEPASVEQRYDQVEFSTCMDDTERRVRETVGHLAQEIRTQVTSQDIETLRQQVADGSYRPDAEGIAARMLLLREED